MCLMRKVSWSVQFSWLLLLYLTRILLCAEVPDDVFAPDFLWKGSYDYKGQKQPLTLTVCSFNATSGKVNATLADTSVEFLLSGETSINHLSLACILRLPPRLRPLFCSSAFYHLLFFALCFCATSRLHTVLGLFVAGVYKRQEARLMLLRYQMRALAHSSLSRITDESWAMDGFVSLLWNLLQLVRN